jgi:hypothetical protein
MGGGEAPVDGGAARLLEGQHRRIERALDALAAGPRGHEGRRLLVELFEILSAHAATERKIVYRAARAGDARALVGESLREHAEITARALDLVDNEDPDGDLGPKIEALRLAFADHAAREELELFPALEESLSRAEVAALVRETSVAAPVAGPAVASIWMSCAGGGGVGKEAER